MWVWVEHVELVLGDQEEVVAVFPGDLGHDVVAEKRNFGSGFARMVEAECRAASLRIWCQETGR